MTPLSFFKKNTYSRGSVLLSTVVIFIIFFLIMGASVNYINDQFHYGANEEEKAQAFRSSEAGIDTVLFLLNTEAETHLSLLERTEPLTSDVLDPFTAEVMGTYELDFTQLANSDVVEGFTVQSVGRSNSQLSTCYTIDVTIERLSDVGFVATHWEDKRGC